MQKLGVPYPEGFDSLVSANMERQAAEIVGRLNEAGIDADYRSKLVALIAYLQRLGTDIKVEAADLKGGGHD
jgi:cytochrome c oxidase cbb3-type subunit I/II